MVTQAQLRFDRKPETRSRYGLSDSTFHTRIQEGLIPPPVSLGERAVGFPAHETDAVLAAMMAGKPKDEIRALVAYLVEQRQNLTGGRFGKERLSDGTIESDLVNKYGDTAANDD